MKRCSAFLLMFVACGLSTDSALSLLGDSCLIDSDCSGDLVCVFERCYTGCEDSRDCPDGRCVRGELGTNICLQPDDISCALNSDCEEPLICAVDGECRNQCLTHSDCLASQVCASGACAEPEELVDGELPPAPGDNGEGLPCTITSDCIGELICIEHKCLYECQVDADCPSMNCKKWHCVPPGSDVICAPAEQRMCIASPLCTPPAVGIQECLLDELGVADFGPCRCAMGGVGGTGGTPVSAGGQGGVAAAGGAGGFGGLGGQGGVVIPMGGMGGLGGAGAAIPIGGSGGIGGLGGAGAAIPIGGMGGN